MTLTEVIFHAFALLTAGAGLVLALSKNVVYAAFLLFVVLFGMAAMYVFAGADFLAVSQVIVYVGGILIIILFGVMLTHKMRGYKPQTGLVNLVPAGLLALSLFMAFMWVMRSGNFNQALPARVAVSNPEAIGKATLTQWLLPFELVSVLLLAVLIGAAYLARKSGPRAEEDAS